ncbi:MAG: hypothetical protein DMD95_12050, partial [Candidatus Rokuibacteriota bacterium]
MNLHRCRVVLFLTAALRMLSVGQGDAAQPGEAVMAWHVTLAPTWFDPSTAPPQITPFGMLYAIHDAMVRPLPGHKMGNSLAESWKESADGRVYEFKLRRELKFHNGDPVTAEDVKFSFERYRGTGFKEFQTRVEQVEIVDPLTVRFHLKEPWPDFMTYLIMKSVPEGTTRAAMLKTGEADIAYALDGPDAENVKRDPKLQIVASQHASITWVEFPDQWDPKSPWADKRLRLAVNHALNRKAINEAACLGYCPPAGVIIPRVMDFALQAEPPSYDPPKARQLLAAAGYPNGLDAGDLVPIPPFFTTAESVVNYLNAVGIRVKMRIVERAAFYAAWREKKLRNLFITGVGNSGNAASRVQEIIYSKGSYAYGGYPDIDDLFQQQARERDLRKREALL